MYKNIYFGFNYLKAELAPAFKTKYLREDVFSGLTVACIAIPLSLAIAMASGVDPGVGLISAVIGGIIAAIFGGTSLAVTGPAAAMAIIIASNVEQHGLTGLLIIGLICGLLQFICGILRLGRYAKLVPLPVVAAFTAGIGFIIIIGQLPKALQLPAPDQNHVFEVIQHIGTYIDTMNPMAFLIALGTLVILKILPRYLPKAPTPLIAVAVPSILVYLGGIKGIVLVGSIPHYLSLPHLPSLSSIENWHDLCLSALSVFALASLETLLSSSAVDSMGKGDIHNPNQELIGQGLANIGVSLFGGLPVTGVIARSSVNIAAGAKTRRSAIFHSLAVLAAIYLFPHLIEQIPVAALAGILLSAGASMINWSEFVHFWRTDRGEAIIYLITFISIITSDLVEGVQAGITVAFLIVAVKMLKTKANIRLWTNKVVMRVGLTGGMTFWSFERLHKLQEYILEHVGLKFVVLEFAEISGLDSSGAGHLVNTAQGLSASGIKVVFHGLTHKQQVVLASQLQGDKVWYETNTENEIKALLEQAGVAHSAPEVLKHGMQKYLVEFAKERKQLITTLAQGQNPHTLLFTCSDSRLNPNSFLSSGIGELFIVRNVGNVVPPFSTESEFSETAAIEFALDHLEIRNIVICAHTDCGAIKACINAEVVASGGLSNWLKLIDIGFVSQRPVSLSDGVRVNLVNQVNNLKTYPRVQQLLALGKLNISAWVYDVHTADILEWDFANAKLVSLIEKASVD